MRVHLNGSQHLYCENCCKSFVHYIFESEIGNVIIKALIVFHG
jgi:hypothetical protein